jgi:hypothetical protein
LLWRGDLFHEVHVAFIGREEIHCDGAQWRIARLFKYDGATDMGQRHATERDRDLWGEQACTTGTIYQLPSKVFFWPVRPLSAIGLEGDDLRENKVAHACL